MKTSTLWEKAFRAWADTMQVDVMQFRFQMEDGGASINKKDTLKMTETEDGAVIEAFMMQSGGAR